MKIISYTNLLFTFFIVSLAHGAPICTSTVCKTPYGKNWARWPKSSANKTYPLVAFGHGMLTPIMNGYISIVDHIVEQGFVVVAPNTCITAASGIAGYCPDFGKDVLSSIVSALALKRSSSPPDWTMKIDENSGMSLVGHSMGGGAVLKLAGGMYGSVPNLTAVVALHPACEVEDCGIVASSVKKIHARTLFAATPYDAFVVAGVVKNYHQQIASTIPSIYTELYCPTAVDCDGHIMSNTHLAPTDQGGALWNAYVTQFLNCYVHGSGCDKWSCPPAFPNFGNRLKDYDLKPCKRQFEEY